MSRFCQLTLLLLIGFAFLLLAACEQNKYKAGEQLYSQRRYAAAIELIDQYIHSGKNGAFVSRAELVRSYCYYELGLAAFDKENWVLAIRLFKLANSEPADLELAKVYFTLATAAEDGQDHAKAMSYYELILAETEKSDLVPQVIYLRIMHFLNLENDQQKAWNEYTQLYDRFPDHSFEIAARPYIENFILFSIDQAVGKAINKDYLAALEDLFEIRRYPVGKLSRVDLEISNIYQEMAENAIQDRDYAEANQLFLDALQYYPAKREEIDQRLRYIASLYIEKGNEYLQVRDFDNALAFYNKSFEIIPDYDVAKRAINNVMTIQANLQEAAQAYAEAQNMELARNFVEARRLYNQAYQLDRQAVYAEKAAIMANLIEAEKDPQGFARSIIVNYRNGLLGQRIQAQKRQLLTKYKNDEIRDSGWKILLSTGQYKYEARYDLVTPTENLYYIWQVNLRERTVTPLNKLSEKLMQ